MLRGRGRESQFFICSGDVVVMKRNETAAATARCPSVPQPWNEAKTRCLDTPYMKPDGDTYVSGLAVHSFLCSLPNLGIDCVPTGIPATHSLGGLNID